MTCGDSLTSFIPSSLVSGLVGSCGGKNVPEHGMLLKHQTENMIYLESTN